MLESADSFEMVPVEKMSRLFPKAREISPREDFLFFFSGFSAFIDSYSEDREETGRERTQTQTHNTSDAGLKAKRNLNLGGQLHIISG